MTSTDLQDQLIDEIERREVASLEWGYVDGALGEDQVLELAEEVVKRSGHPMSADDLFEALIEHRLLIEVDGGGGEIRIRSRFAEAVRLLKRLRQLFPNKPWQSAPELVSDFRVDVRPRLVPRREIAPAAALDELGCSAQSLEGKLALALLARPEGEFRLSRFQLKAWRHVAGDGSFSRGVVVCAGTGSGKTLAFYLPTLLDVASCLDSKVPWVKAVSVYPRKELLKDQFTTAFGLARKLDEVLVRERKGRIRLGTFFSLTPSAANPDYVKQAGWKFRGASAICPFLRCPLCDSEMLWKEADLNKKSERLHCASTARCSFVATEDMVALTREGALRKPPDLVFTTMEMVNQRLSDSRRRTLLGLHTDPRLRARLLLLDEIHTYEGSTGAQSALTLRRWRHAHGQPVRVVGLSATLQEAPRFFADLTGIPEQRILEVTPEADHLTPVGPTYQLILRGNPASGTSLLSTSIQTAFLMARILEPVTHQRSGGRIGRRLFAFSDDLDVTNRLFDNLRDAEAYDIFGRPDPKRVPLAALRAQTGNDRGRDPAGQAWRLCESIGWNLGHRLTVTRTTSQDQGVDADSHIVVATSSLEVGFDDPHVGAVLQHKSPYRLASFLQRKGRAGRSAGSRPWMVTVLSDYGRDRQTYQSYEQLFSPQLPPQFLPIKNRYILRMQAVFALIDWLADLASEQGKRQWWWRILNGPAEREEERECQKWVGHVLRDLLRGESSLEARLTSHLRRALELEDDEAQALLWEAPRSLMLEAIPTLARRLATQWGVPTKNVDLLPPEGRVHPLPDFVPSNLFTDLNLPEISIVIPPATTRHSERTESLAILQGLKTVAPGKVTRRFAFERGHLNHWVPVPLEGGVHGLAISTFAESFEYVAQVPLTLDGRGIEVPCYRPRKVVLQSVPETTVSPTSNAFFEWQARFEPMGSGLKSTLKAERGWGRVFESIQFFLQAHRSFIEVTRFSGESAGTLSRQGRDPVSTRTLFLTDEGSPAAIGFQQEVDGVRLAFQLPCSRELGVQARKSPSARAWRSEFFRDCIESDAEVRALTNTFERDGLHQVYLGTLLEIACTRGFSVQEASLEVADRPPDEAFEPMLRALFSSEGGEGEGEGTGRRIERLRQLLGNSALLDRLHALCSGLWVEESVAWDEWVRSRISETLGSCVLQALCHLTPNHSSTETLVADLERPVTPEQGTVWVTESSPGGVGVMEAIARSFSSDRHALFSALEATLAPSDLELASRDLDRFLRLVVEEQELAVATADVREASDHSHRLDLRSRLVNLLSERGLGAHHAFVVALEHRLLRKGLDQDSDRLLLRLVDYWQQQEQCLGLSIPIRTFCQIVTTNPVFSEDLREWLERLAGGALSQTEMVGALVGVLWPREAEFRSRNLDAYNPFRNSGFTDPTLVRAILLPEEILDVDIGDEGARSRILEELSNAGKVRLVSEDASSLQRTVFEFLATPVDVGFLQIYPVVESVTRAESGLGITLILPEVLVP